MQLATRFKSQHGQVLIVALAMVIILGAGLLSLYNTIQLTTQKQQLTDAADAAAYSGAVVLAQGLNYTAYTNRAMLANSAMIGQMVSLRSTLSMSQWYWKNTETAWKALSAISKFVPYVGPVISGVANGISKFADLWGDRVVYAARKMAEYLTLTNTAAIGLTNQVMWGAQQVQLAESIATFEPILVQVAKENAPDANIDPVMYGTAFGPLTSLGMLAYTIEPKVRQSRRTLGTNDADTDLYLQYVSESNKGTFPPPYVSSRQLLPNAVGLWIATGCDQPPVTGSLTGLFEPNAGLGPPIDQVITAVQTVGSLLSPVGNFFMCMFGRAGGTELVQLENGNLAWTAIDGMSLKIPLLSYLIGDLPFAGGAVTSYVDSNQVGRNLPDSVEYMVDRIKGNDLNQTDNRKKYFGHKGAQAADCIEFMLPGAGDWYTVSTTTRNDGNCAVLATGTDKSTTEKGIWSGDLSGTADRIVRGRLQGKYGDLALPINADLLANLVEAAQSSAIPVQAGGEPRGAGNLMPAGSGADAGSSTVTGLPNTQVLTAAGGQLQNGMSGLGGSLRASLGGLTGMLSPAIWLNGGSIVTVFQDALLGDTSGIGSEGSGPDWILRLILSALGLDAVVDLMTLKISDGVEAPRNRSVNRALNALGDGLPKWFWDVRVQKVTVGNPKPVEVYNLDVTDQDRQDFNPRRYGLGPLVYAPLLMDTDKIKTAEKLPAGGDAMGLPDYASARPGLRAIGKARVFYRQPQDHWLSRYKTQELANLLLPHWQARNEGLSYADKWGILAIDGLTGAYNIPEAQVP